jgi:hypothetical protein
LEQIEQIHEIGRPVGVDGLKLLPIEKGHEPLLDRVVVQRLCDQNRKYVLPHPRVALPFGEVPDTVELVPVIADQGDGDQLPAKAGKFGVDEQRHGLPPEKRPGVFWTTRPSEERKPNKEVLGALCLRKASKAVNANRRGCHMFFSR